MSEKICYVANQMNTSSKIFNIWALHNTGLSMAKKNWGLNYCKARPKVLIWEVRTVNSDAEKQNYNIYDKFETMDNKFEKE